MQALFVAWYNFARKHETVKGKTPAMASGLSDHVSKKAITSMAKLISVICVALVAGCVQTTETENANSNKADLPKLQGDWVAVSHELVGVQVTFKDEYEPYKLSIVEDRVDETIGTKTKHGKVELNEPNNITFTIANRGQWGVYKFDGDKLIITWATGKNTEPTESAKATFVMERVQD